VPERLLTLRSAEDRAVGGLHDLAYGGRLDAAGRQGGEEGVCPVL
jgi:hypothetical protein